MITQPSIFLSHGSPMIAITPGSAHDFLRCLGKALTRPDAIIIVSAHYDLPGVAVTAAAHPPTIHDFGGFPEALYKLQYPAPGDPALAADIAAHLTNSGYAVTQDASRGLDHGAWTPLMLMFPDADIPVVQVSIDSRRSPEWHAAVGAQLAHYRKRNILIVGSGNMTHNLRAFFTERHEADDPPPEWVESFADWLDARLIAGDRDAAINAVALGPYGRENHPTPDHFLPLPVAIGAGGETMHTRRLHRSYDHGVLAMDAYAFD